MGSFTTHYNLYRPDAGETPWHSQSNENLDKIDAGLFSSSVSNLTFSLPLLKSGSNVSLTTNATNLRVTSNALNTIQNIATSSSPTFQSLTIKDNLVVGLDPDDSYIIMSASIYQLGNIYLAGNIQLYNDLKVTGSAYVSESLVARNLTVNPNAGDSGGTVPSGYVALISGSAKISGSLLATSTISSSFVQGDAGQILGQLVVFNGPLQVSNAEAGYTEKFHVDGDANITGSVKFGSTTTLNHTVTGSFNITPSASLMNYPLTRHLGSSVGPPVISPLREGDTYWDTSSSRGYMYLGGSWRQIT